MKNKKAFFTTKWLTYTALLTALVVATTAIPPAVTPAGNVYWCDGMIFLAAYLLDPLASFIVGGLGTFLYDLCFGNAVMAPVSLILHGLQAASVSALLHYAFKKLPEKYESVWAGISSVAGAVIIILGYFIFYWLIAPLVLSDKTYGLVYGATRIARNVIQEVIGVAVAMVICYATTFKRQLKKSNLLPDFRREVLSAENCEECGQPAE